MIKPGLPYKHLFIYATKLGDNSEIVQMDSEDEKWKDLIISDAVRASMSIPGAYKPHTLHYKHNGNRGIIDNELYIDGGLLNNFPIKAFDKKKYIDPEARDGNCPCMNKKTLGFSLFSPDNESMMQEKDEIEEKDFMGVVRDIFASYYSAEKIINVEEYDEFRVIQINNNGVGMFHFDLSEEQKNRLVKSGKKGAKSFLKKIRSSLMINAFIRNINKKLRELIPET